MVIKRSVSARMLRTVRRRIVSGLLVLVPLGVTAWILKILYGWTSGIFDVWIRNLLEDRFPDYAYLTPVISIAALVVLVYLVGGIAAMVAGRRLIAVGEAILLRIPVVKWVYSSAKQVIEAVALPDKGAFKAVMLLEFPRSGIRAIGFLTGTILDPEGTECYRIFIPTSPNPTTGFFEIVPRDQAREIDMTVEDAFKTLISGGIIAPDRLEYRSGPSAGGLDSYTNTS